MALNREAVIRAAEKYVSKGKLDAAIKEYRKVLAENPNDANTLNRVGDLYARTERFGEAVKLFTQIAEQYTRDGFFVKAIAIYKKIIKLDPTSLPVYERLAELYFKQGLLNEARTQYQVLADYYQKHDNATSAITIYQKMAEMEPENPSFHLKLAELFASQRLTDKALGEYRRLADLLIVKGSVDEAAQVYLKAFELGGDQSDFVRETVMGLHDGGHVGAAARVLSAAVERYPEAASLTAEIGFGTQKEEVSEPDPESLELDAPGAVAEDAGSPDASFAEPPIAEQPPDESPTFDPAYEDNEAEPPELDETDETYVLPEVSFADAEEAVAELADLAGVSDAQEAESPQDGWSFENDGAFQGATFQDTASFALQETGSFAPPYELEAEEVFTFDLEDDEVPETLVEPPADMLEAPEVPAADPSEDADRGEEAAASSAPGELEPLELEPLDDAAGFAVSEDPEAEEMTLDLEALEIDLEDLPATADPALPDPESPGALPSGEPVDFALEDEEIGADTPAWEQPAVIAQQPEAGPPLVRREEDLLAEARVFAKYGLQEKALDRLGELMEIHPEHLAGLELRTRIHLEAGRQEEAIAGANEVARVALATGRLDPWSDLKDDLVEAGYSVDEGRVSFRPSGKPADDDRIAQLLEDLSLEDFDVSPMATAPRGADPYSEISVPAAEVPPAVAPLADGAGTSDGAGAARPSLVEQLGLEELQDGAADAALEEALEAAVEGAPDGAGADHASADHPVSSDAAGGAAFDETGMSWLDDGKSETAEPTEALFDEEDDFFDLAAELERELTEDELTVGQSVEPQDQSLEDIIEGFKRGVAENLSPEDYDTHYNLGIAYREMGLLDEAIGEFQLAAKDERYAVDCSSLLGSCFLEKGLPELAVRWFRKGLESPAINDEATAGLLYDMGNAYLSLGDSEAAYKTFVEVYGLNSNYRDIAGKLEALGAPDPAI